VPRFDRLLNGLGRVDRPERRVLHLVGRRPPKHVPSPVDRLELVRLIGHLDELDRRLRGRLPPSNDGPCSVSEQVVARPRVEDHRRPDHRVEIVLLAGVVQTVENDEMHELLGGQDLPVGDVVVIDRDLEDVTGLRAASRHQ